MNVASRMVHTAIAVMSTKQALAYSPMFTPPHEGAGVMLLSDQGEFLWVYALLWSLSAILSFYGMVVGKGRRPLLLYIFMCICWAGGYAGAWAVSGYTSDDLMTACTYLSTAIGFAAIYRYAELLQDKQVETTTATITTIKEENDLN